MTTEQCKKKVFKEFHHYQCQRRAVQDGYCKQHHPDSVKKRREESDRRYEESRKKSAWYRLELANKQIQTLLEILKTMTAFVELKYGNTDGVVYPEILKAKEIIANTKNL